MISNEAAIGGSRLSLSPQAAILLIDIPCSNKISVKKAGVEAS
jgi:hypothetical protein